MPDSIKKIKRSAFESCILLESINLPEGLESIEDRAFFGCINLSGVVIPSSVTALGEQSFLTYSNDAKYTYELYVLDEKTKYLYSNNVSCVSTIYIKTENPDPNSFEILNAFFFNIR